MDNRYIGKKLDGRYEILELVGVGGMANVYKAYDIAGDRIVAVKILKDELAGNEEFLRRFKNESKAIALLSHPNIVKVYDVIFSDKVNAIVMEYIDGITLKEYIEQQHVLSWKEAVHFTVQILRALQRAHDQGIVHRDIKPQNIMLLRDGSIRVMDFGIARFSRSETRTMTDKAIGSVHYISPEQARGDNIDAKTDIYSVGVILFEMLTGQLPFDADSPVTVAIKQIQSMPKRPRQINPNIPEGLENITMRAMQKDVNKRYQSAAEMLRDIDEFKRNPSISFEYKYMTQEQPKKFNDAVETNRRQKREQEKEERKTPIVPIMTGIVSAFVVVTICFVLFMFITNNPFTPVRDVTAPNFVGLSYNDVIADEQYSNFKFEIETQDYSEYEQGVIYEQSPEAGRSIKENATIRVKVSLGYRQIVIPDGVVNVEASIAIARLKDLGLEVVESRIYDSRIQEGYVVRVSPDVNETVQPGSKVTVYISLGRETVNVQVPNVVGYHVDEAREMIKNKGFLVGTVTPVESDRPGGEVVRQTPNGYEEMPEGTTINLEVSDTGTTEKTLTMKVDLPTGINREVTVEAYLGDARRVSTTLNPSEQNQWYPTITGVGMQRVRILIDGRLCYEYLVDFDLGTYMVDVDQSSEFTQ